MQNHSIFGDEKKERIRDIPAFVSVKFIKSNLQCGG